MLAWRALTIAWGFSGDCRSARKYDADAYELYLTASDFYNAGEVADDARKLVAEAKAILDRGRIPDQREADGSTAHSVPAAFSQPFARGKTQQYSMTNGQ